MGFEDIKYDDFTEEWKLFSITKWEKFRQKIYWYFQQLCAFASWWNVAKKKMQMKKSFLEKNKENPKITELESGLQYEILVEGNGEIPK